MPRRFKVAAATAAALLAASPAWAQDEQAPVPPPEPLVAPNEEKPSELADAVEVVVSATRRETPAFDVPWLTDEIAAEEITRDRMRRTLPDALLDQPGVMVQRTSYGQASPFVRGFTGYHTVLLVDGIRLNNSTFRSGPNQYWSTVDALSVERLELVRGPNSVLYGSDAVGGTVNAVLRRRESYEPGTHANVRSYTRWASAEGSWTQRVETEGNHDDFGWLIGGNYKSFDDLKVGGSDDRQDQTGYREQDADFRLDFRESKESTWTFGVQYVNQDDVPRTHRTVDSVPFHGTTVGDELKRDLTQTRELYYLRNRRSVGWAFADALEWTVSFHRQEEVQERDRDAVRSDEQGYAVDTWGAQLQLEKRSSIGTWTYGFEMWDDDVNSFRKNSENGVEVLETVQGPVADDAAYRLLGVYAQDEFALGDTTVTAGARYTKAWADADTVDDPTVPGNDPATPGNVIGFDDSWDNVVGSLRAVHPVAQRWNLFGGVSQGFRAPNLSDLTRLDDTSGVETPSLDLDPEEFTQAELGVKAEYGRWFGQVGVWRTWVKDLIVPSPTGAVVGTTPEVRKDNVGDGEIDGIEAEVAWRFVDAWTISVGGSWQDGEIDQLLPNGQEVSAPASRLMPLTGVFTLTWKERALPVRAWVSGRFADEQDELSLKDATDTERIPPGGTPGYGVISLGASWEVCKNAMLSAAIENVFDKEYRIHGSGVNEPGRNFVLALDLRF